LGAKVSDKYTRATGEVSVIFIRLQENWMMPTKS